MWSKCPKGVCCKRKLTAVTAASVIQGNQRAVGPCCVLDEMCMEHFGVYAVRGYRVLNGAMSIY